MLSLFLQFIVVSQKSFTIVDEKGNGIPFVSVVISCNEQEEQLISSFDGVVESKLACDELKVKLKHVSYQTKWETITTNKQKVTLYPSDVQMTELVVTGQYVPSTQGSSVHKVKVIDSKRIQAQGAVNLQELMEQEMNIRVSQDQFLGSSMSIQGLSGENVKILIDGVPVIGRQNGNIDLTQINLNDVERIEVVEGPLSVNYGTNALAGTINIITKKSQDKLSVSGRAYYETVGQYNVDGSLNFNLGKQLFKLSGGRNYFDGYSQVDTSRVMDWKPKEQWFGGLDYSSSINKTEWRIKSNLFLEKLTARGEPRAPYYESAFDDYFYTTRIDNSIFLKSPLSKNLSANILGGYNYYQREKRAYLKDLVNIEYTLLDAPDAQDTSVFDLIFSRGSIVYAKDSSKINGQLGYDINVETSRGKRIEGQTQQIGDYALFASAEYLPTKKIKLKPGLRYSYNTQYKSPLIPSIHAKYQITQHLSVRSSYGRGFRAPSLKELYFLFVDQNHNILGNQNLKAEVSQNTMLQMSYKRGIKRGVYNFDLSFFHNKVSDQISLALVDISEQLYTYTNIGKFYSQGLNFNSGFRYKTYKTSFGFAYTGRYNLESESNPNIDKFSYSPEVTTSFIYEVEEWQTSFNLFYKYSGKLLGYAVDEVGTVSQYQIADYGMMDFSVINLFWKKRLTTTLGVKNIFDVQNINSTQFSGGVHSGGGGSLPVSWGRTFFLKLAFMFPS